MHRRNLAKHALTGAAIASALPFAAQAAPRAENIVFTAADPGHWANVAALHVPVTSVSGNALHVHTPHPMSQAHYIVSHTVVLENGVFLDRKTFTYTDQPVSTHMLPAGYKGPVTVTSTCNLHDFWTKQLMV